MRLYLPGDTRNLLGIAFSASFLNKMQLRNWESLYLHHGPLDSLSKLVFVGLLTVKQLHLNVAVTILDPIARPGIIRARIGIRLNGFFLFDLPTQPIQDPTKVVQPQSQSN